MNADVSDSLRLLTGKDGGVIFTDTSAHTGSWRRLTVLATASVTVILNGTTYSTVSMTAGVDLFGKITSVTLGSGSVVVYK